MKIAGICSISFIFTEELDLTAHTVERKVGALFAH